jgi:hypothetical protein
MLIFFLHYYSLMEAINVYKKIIRYNNLACDESRGKIFIVIKSKYIERKKNSSLDLLINRSYYMKNHTVKFTITLVEYNFCKK